jgi:hypothetical protein
MPKTMMMIMTNRCVNLAALLDTALTSLLSISHPQLALCHFTWPLVGTHAFQATELRVSVYQQLS